MNVYIILNKTTNKHMYTPCVIVDCVEVDTKITKTYNIQSENNTLIP